MTDYNRAAEYRRGYVDGAHSLDAERAAIVSRLRWLPLDGNSQENLSQIAGAIWHSDFGWTAGACAALRDKIIELFGGAYLRETDGYKPENEMWQRIGELSAIATRDMAVAEIEHLRSERDQLKAELERYHDLFNPRELISAELIEASIQPSPIIARDLGWLQASEVALWALVTTQREPPIVGDEFVVEYGEIVRRLNKEFFGNDQGDANADNNA